MVAKPFSAAARASALEKVFNVRVLIKKKG
jgi:hypothetical protein